VALIIPADDQPISQSHRQPHVSWASAKQQEATLLSEPGP